MSKISYKLANKIAVVMADNLFRVRIQHAEEQLKDALTYIARQAFPPEVIKIVSQYPQFFVTSDRIVVKGIDGGKYENVYVDGCINFQIPKRPFNIQVDDKMISSLKEIDKETDRRKLYLYDSRAKTCNDIAERIHDCKTIARLEKEFPEAYIVMLSIKSTEKETK